MIPAEVYRGVQIYNRVLDQYGHCFLVIPSHIQMGQIEVEVRTPEGFTRYRKWYLKDCIVVELHKSPEV